MAGPIQACNALGARMASMVPSSTPDARARATGFAPVRSPYRPLTRWWRKHRSSGANRAGSDLACAKLIHQALEVTRQRRAPGHGLAARRMLEAQLRGVQRLPGEGDAMA